ncbi:hypothetical protein MGEO_18380 [Marivita geojedonensis]|uniref:Transglutaminase n=2 Tax=Marivita geojedonensis TaxID=1123756 RepID=A0A1X4NEK2_9RHOB|nr:hypothetical protein MGEO_18380 [Marivita geojedonensis]
MAGRRVDFTRALAVSIALMLPSIVDAAGQFHGPHLVAKFAADPPRGAVDLCVRYQWACSPKWGAGPLPPDILKLAKQINNDINRRVRQIEDQRQYGRKEYWSLPTKRGGDCEDFALLKKAALMQRGISPENLLIATVLDHRRNNHAVLVLRTTAGDYVLDNVTNRILLWSKTRYSFLKMQDPNAPHKWHALLAGGVFN